MNLILLFLCSTFNKCIFSGLKHFSSLFKTCSAGPHYPWIVGNSKVNLPKHPPLPIMTSPQLTPLCRPFNPKCQLFSICFLGNLRFYPRTCLLSSDKCPKLVIRPAEIPEKRLAFACTLSDARGHTHRSWKQSNLIRKKRSVF